MDLPYGMCPREKEAAPMGGITDCGLLLKGIGDSGFIRIFEVQAGR